jgi:hypothetical protein
MAAAQLFPALTTIGAVGQVTDGATPSRTVTVNEQFDELPAASLAVQVTVCDPTGSVIPDGGTHTTVTPGQLSGADART